jgi:hypothetical protein
MSVLQNIRLLSALDRFTKSIGKDGTMGNWLMSILALIGAAAGIFQPQLTHAIAAHPAIASAVGGAITIVAHLLPSPVAGGSSTSGS